MNNRFSISLPLFFFFFFVLSSLSGQFTVNRTDPPHWWTGMKNDTLHLLLYGNELEGVDVKIKTEHVRLIEVRETKSHHYLFLDLLIGKQAKSGNIDLELKKGVEILSIAYPLKKRDSGKHRMAGLGQADLIYLIMPDRFANGDPSNDAVLQMLQNTANRDSAFERHGGDLQGILDHLDYFNDLGVTALWLNPAEENDQPSESYHGYAITDHYNIDPRLGDNRLYKALVSQMHARGLKMIRDVVFNHFGNEHPLIKDLPDSSWIHHWNTFTKTSYRTSTLLDPHAAEADLRRFLQGWFDGHMPDMNYANQDLQNYMIQNSIWWIEEMDIDAYRIDTYTYPEQGFMQRWAAAVKNEFPDFFLFAETWVQSPVIQAWFAGGNKLNQGETHLDGVTDFQMNFALTKALTTPFGWTSGVSEIYYSLVNDVLYAKPENNVIFLDNHDMNRILGTLNNDTAKFRMGIALLMTMRGIPVIFYGTEIGMAYTGNHGIIRTDFPGGWPGDPVNKFEIEGRTTGENGIYSYVSELAHWRHNSAAVSKGKLKQFVPEEGVYVYFRFSGDNAVMVAVNQSNRTVKIDPARFDEVLRGRREFRDVIRNTGFTVCDNLILAPGGVYVLEVK